MALDLGHQLPLVIFSVQLLSFSMYYVFNHVFLFQGVRGCMVFLI